MPVFLLYLPDNTDLDTDDMMDPLKKDKWFGLEMGKCIVYCMTDVNCKSVAFDDKQFVPSKCVRSSASWRNETMQASFPDHEAYTLYALR